VSSWRLCAGFDEACLRPILKLPPRDLEQIHDIARPKTPPDGIHSDGLEMPKSSPSLGCRKRRVGFLPKSTQNTANLFRFRVKPFVTEGLCRIFRRVAALTGVG
jgi:hypothetical protein